MVKYSTGPVPVFAALADPTRWDIMERLAKAELSAGEIASPYQMSLPAISKHLKILERAELVNVASVGTRRLYRPNPKKLLNFKHSLERSPLFWEGALTRLANHVEQKERTRRAR